MVIDVARSHIKIGLKDRTATLAGEMFFPEGGKMGFVLFRSEARHWDAPNISSPITKEDWVEIIADISEDFAKGGHTLEIE